MPETALERFLKDRELRELEGEAGQPAPGLGHVLAGGVLGALAGSGVGYALGGLKGLGAGLGVGGGVGLYIGDELMKRRGNEIQQAQDALTLPPEELKREIRRRALSKFYSPEQYEAISGRSNP